MSLLSLAGVMSYLRRLRPGDGAGEDGDLLARFAAGDDAALEGLVRRHAAMVWGVCRRVLGRDADAEDAFQATFLVLVRKARALADGRPLAPWLHTVATRTAAKARALAARRASREGGAVEVAATGRDDAALREARAVVDEEVRRLPGRYREAVVLCYLEGRTNEEAARQLGCPKGTVLSRLSRGREWLRRRLERRGLGPCVAGGLGPVLAPGEVPVAAVAGAGRAGAASGAAVALAEGVMTTMMINQFRWVGAACVALLLAAGGAGWLAGAGAEGKKAPPGEVAKVAAPGGQPAEKKAAGKRPEERRVDRAGAPRGAGRVAPEVALAKAVEFPGLDDPKTTLMDTLDQLAKVHGVAFDVNERAFKNAAMADVLRTEIASTPIAPMKTSLDVVLRKVLSRVPAPVFATYLIRNDRIEITTDEAARAELGLPRVPNGEEVLWPLVLVTHTASQERLSTALTRIAETTGQNILLDPRAKKQAEAEVTWQMRNVPIDTALRLLADMAELEVVAMDNVFYVTTPEKAERLRKQKAADKGGKRRSFPSAGGGAE